jgi:hypothetical protein
VQPYTFLSALPAVLGLAGFFLYQILGANKSGDEVSRRIIEKVRSDVTAGIPPDQRLKPKQVERLLEQDHHLKMVVGDHDYRLLKQALTQQFVKTVLVYVFALGFCSWSIYLFVQTQTTQNTANPVIGNQIRPNQSSTGNNSPNVNSTGSGPTTVIIQDQTPRSPVGKKK